MNNKTRRAAVKALTVGVPAVWAKPVVESAVLPSHAQTTCVETLCVIYTFNLEGTYRGQSSFELYAGSCGAPIESVTVPDNSVGPGLVVESNCYTLGPGTYYFSGSGGFGGSSGAGSFTLEAVCCDTGQGVQVGRSVPGPGPGGGGTGFDAEIDVSPDGRCEITMLQGNSNPCN